MRALSWSALLAVLVAVMAVTAAADAPPSTSAEEASHSTPSSSTEQPERAGAVESDAVKHTEPAKTNPAMRPLEPQDHNSLFDEHRDALGHKSDVDDHRMHPSVIMIQHHLQHPQHNTPVVIQHEIHHGWHGDQFGDESEQQHPPEHEELEHPHIDAIQHAIQMHHDIQYGLPMEYMMSHHGQEPPHLSHDMPMEYTMSHRMQGHEHGHGQEQEHEHEQARGHERQKQRPSRSPVAHQEEEQPTFDYLPVLVKFDAARHTDTTKQAIEEIRQMGGRVVGPGNKPDRLYIMLPPKLFGAVYNIEHVKELSKT